ncbi:MAG TPA: hypothetical protein VFC00_02570 [Micromonosporaceae bacterium]|nr:hypothetical protein [Micromonosporaceae bacterium]
MTIEAAGVLRRLGQGARPLKSPLRRAILASSPVVYWSLEDAAGSTQGASSVSGIAPLIVSGTVTFASSDVDIPGSAGALDASGGGRLDAALPTFAFTIDFGWGLDFIASYKTATPGGEGVLVSLETTGATYTFTLSTTDLTVGEPHHVAYWFYQSGAGGVDLSIDTYYDGTFFDTETFASTALPSPTAVHINPNSLTDDTLPVIAHLSMHDVSADLALDAAAALSGYAGETAADRLARLCAEEGLSFVLVGDAADTAAMGPQQIDTLVNLIQHAVDADQGMLYEPRQILGLAYRTRTSLYNQVAAILDYSAAHLSGELAPIDDDQLLLNDVEARRIDGSSARYTVDTGPLSTQDPPDGVGTYDESLEYDVYADNQLLDIASERAHIGTWDEARYPTVSVNLARAPFRADASLLNGVVGLDIGDYLAVDNPPAWLPPNLIELLLQGYTEHLTAFEWRLTSNNTPYGPYRVFRIEGGTLGVLGLAGQTLDGEHAANDGTLSVATAAGYPLLATSLTVFADIMIAGERMTVQGVVGASSPQIVTVTRAVNGVSKVLPAGSEVKLFPRTGIAR